MLNDIWTFLTDPENRIVLSWLGGGLIVVCGGLWTVMTFFLGRKRPTSTKPSPALSQRAKQGSLAAGGDIHIKQSSGLSGVSIVLLVLALAGAAIVIAVNTAGRTAVVKGCGSATAGDLSGSTVSVEC